MNDNHYNHLFLDMGKGVFLSKALAVTCAVVAVAAAATIIALAVVYAQEKSKNESWDHYRLPESLSPVSYNVTLRPRLKPNANGLYIFTGESTVVFKCVKETDLIIIHSNKLNLTNFDGFLAKLTGLNGATAPNLKKTWLEIPTQYLVLQLSGPLKVGNSYELFTDFVGELSDDLGGFYRSVYVEDGVEKVLATTQMQPTDARKAFPCFDEPAMKATMSTYLLAFVVCEFTFITNEPVGGPKPETLIRIWARRKAIEAGQGDYALEKTGPILQFFEDYYKSPYPLEKSDQIALPDFGAGAMENWGLITYRETALLFNPDVSSNGDKEWWFGNLVTTRWWNDLWLNEGFATYKDLIVLNEVIGVMGVDALASSHPLTSKEEDVQRPEQISELFDSITYSKAVDNSSVVLPASVEVIMNRWILQMGFPVVTINTQTGKITQKHFLLDPESVVDRPSEFKVNYDAENWERLLAKLSSKHQDIPVINRAQIIDDAFNLARARIVDTTLALRTTTFLDKEVEYMPWQTFRRNVNYYFLMFDRSEVYGPMQAYLKQQVEPLFKHFKNITGNWTEIPEMHTEQYNQVNAISMACSTGVDGCKELTSGWFTEWMNNPAVNKYNATIASEADKLMSALSCSKKPWLLNRYLEYCLDPKKIRKQDATSTIISIASNSVGQPLAWDFVRSRWDYIFNEYGGGSFSFGGLISGVTRRFSSEFEYKQFKADNAANFGSGTAALEQALERTKANMKWVALNKKPVLDWFENSDAFCSKTSSLRPSCADRYEMYRMVRRRVSILVRVCPSGATDSGKYVLRWFRDLVRSLILCFSLSLAVWRFFPGYLDLDFFVVETKQSKGLGSFVWKALGEKQNESTEEVGDKELLLALKYPGSEAASKAKVLYCLSIRVSKRKDSSWSCRSEQ
ncbi:hypothetical protein F7725_025881 [Dissostichus mawsoni]|uniref:Aminopeptidase n=1 Tax=Dissostichus mawsoni TaxID=36200 RepID=A0A7J5X5I0_DISMA|nr:hypothetical protein F7725_025881 [Dissostichus mawsoni]